MITHEERSTATGATAVLIDSVSFITEADEGRVVVCASHGGASAGEYASRYRPGLIVFNDAGVGKNSAGLEALAMLDVLGVAACTVSHDTAMIGDVADQWESGVLSHVNRSAAGAVRAGQTVQSAVDAWSGRG